MSQNIEPNRSISSNHAMRSSRAKKGGSSLLAEAKAELRQIKKESWFKGTFQTGEKSLYIDKLANYALSIGDDLLNQKKFKEELKKWSVDDLCSLEAFLTHSDGNAVFRRSLETAGGENIKHQCVNLTALRHILHGIRQAKRALPELNQLSGGRLTQEAKNDFVTDYGIVALESIDSMKPLEQAMLSYIKEATEQQYRADGRSQLECLHLMECQTDVFMHAPGRNGIAHVVKDVMNTTAVANTQTLHENLDAIYRKSQTRTAEALMLSDEIPWSIMREQHPSIRLQSMDENNRVSPEKLTTNIMITHPQTMETHSVRVPLPFDKEMAVKELKQEIKYLSQFVAGHEADVPEDRHERFRAFNDELTRRFVLALNDHNRLPGRSSMQIAGSSPANHHLAQLVQEGTSQSQEALRIAALNVTSERHIYVTEQGLSLLPPKVGGQLHLIGGFTQSDEKKLKEAFLKGRPTNLSVPYKEGNRVVIEDAQITMHTEVAGNPPDLRMKTTIKNPRHPELTIERRTDYRIRGNDTKESVTTRVMQSDLLIRDLLLAKADYMDINKRGSF